MRIASCLANRAVLSLTTIPDSRALCNVVAVSVATTVVAGITASTSGFIDPFEDFDPPSWPPPSSPRSTLVVWRKPLSAFLFPSLIEEIFWRGIFIPHPSSTANTASLWPQAVLVLVLHVASHPLAGRTVWPRGREIFEDPRFLCLASIVLGGATIAYVVSGGSVWAAAFVHGLPVALWRDIFGGETKLKQCASTSHSKQN